MNIIKTILGLIVLMCVLAYNKFSATDEAEEGTAETEVLSIPSDRTKTLEVNDALKSNGEIRGMALDEIDYEKCAQPVLKTRRAEKLIDHKAYRLSYNKKFKVPNWVFYELTRQEVQGKLQRSDNFRADPYLKPEDASQLEDYRHSGWDRGHMAPSMDMNWDPDILDESYFLSNMCPQGHDFNSGIWLDLEHEVRFWAKRDSAVCVVCGPILPDQRANNYRRLKKSDVIIPESFYKVIFAPFAKKGPRAIAFIMPNEQQNDKISSFAVTVDSVETLTGIDFFPILPDDIEETVESSFNLLDWFRKKDI